MAKKKINKNVVALLSLFGFGALIGLAALMLHQLGNRDPKHLVELADRYKAESQWQQAALFYSKAFERSHDPRHLVLVGDMLLANGDVPRALASWRKSLVYNPDLIEAHQRRLDMLLEYSRLYGRAQDWKDLLEAAEAMLKLEQSKIDVAAAHNAKGLALANLTHDDPANAERGMEELKKAVALAPSTMQFALDQAVYSIRQGKTTEGEQQFRDLFAKYSTPGGDSSKVHLTYGQYLSSRKQYADARKEFEQALQLAGDDKEALQSARTGLANFLTQRWGQMVRDESQKAQAQELLATVESLMKKAIEADSESFEPYLQLALLYQAADRPADALKVCEQRVDKPFSRKGVQGPRNAFSMFLLNIRASEACVALGVAATEKESPTVRDQWFAKAQEFVDDAKGEMPAHPRVNTQTARIRIAQGNYRAALSELRTADEAYNGYGWIDWENKKLLARVHVQLNEAGAAKEVIEKAVPAASAAIGDDPSFWTLYGQVLYHNGELDRAMALADRVLLTDAEYPDAKQLKAAILERQGNAKQQPTNASSATRALVEARERLLDNDTEQALQVLTKALEQDPADVQLVATTARILIDLKRPAEAQSVLEKAAKSKPDDKTIQKLRLLAREDLSPAERDRLMIELIDAESDGYKRALERVAYFSGKDDSVQALAALKEAEKHLAARDTPLAQVNTLTQYRALLMAKLRLGADLKDESALASARDAAVKNDVDGAGGKSILGAYHMARNEAELAIKAFRDAVAAQPTDARTLTLLGQCLQSTNEVTEAKSTYERAVRANPDEGLAWRGLAMLAKARNDAADYDTAFAKAEKLIPADPWVQSQILERSEASDPKAAIARRERQRTDKPDDLQNISRLAALYEIAKDYPKADECYAKLLDAKPNEMEIIAAVSKYYRRTDRADKALELANAYANRQTTPETKADAQILVASHLLNQGDVAGCEKTLLAAAAIAETSDVVQSLAEFYFRPANRPKDALPWFDKAVKLAEAKKSSSLANIQAARISCLLHRSVNEQQTAQKAIEEFIRAYPDDQRGLLLQSEWHVRAGSLDKAIESLSTYLAKNPNDATILFQRAQHQIAQGRMNLAISDLEHIKRVNPLGLNYEPRIQLAKLYLRSGRRDLGIRELESLVEESNSAARPLEELTEVYIRENRLSDADRIVTAQLNRGTNVNDARWYFLRGRISMLLNDFNKALTDFLRGAELQQNNEEAMEHVLDAYAGTQRFADGASYFEAHRKPDLRNPTVLARYARVLAGADQKPKAVEQFRAAMEQARNETTDAVRDVTDQLQQAFPQPDEAVALFRQNPPTGTLGRANDHLLARLCRIAEKTDDAAAILDRMIQTAASDGERASLWYEKGEMYQLAKEPMKSKEAYEKSLTFSPNNWITLNNLAYLLSDALGQNKEALKYAQQAVTIADNPKTIDELHAALDTLGWIYVGLRENSLAISELSRAVRLRPDQTLTYYHLGEAYRRNQQFDQAAEILETGRRMAINMNDKSLQSDIETSIQKNSRRDGQP